MPYEILNKKFRVAQKNIDREVSQIQNVATELEKLLQKSGVTVSEVSTVLSGLEEKLTHLKRKVRICVDNIEVVFVNSNYQCKLINISVLY